MRNSLAKPTPEACYFLLQIQQRILPTSTFVVGFYNVCSEQRGIHARLEFMRVSYCSGSTRPGVFHHMQSNAQVLASQVPEPKNPMQARSYHEDLQICL